MRNIENEKAIHWVGKLKVNSKVSNREDAKALFLFSIIQQISVKGKI